MTQQLMEADVTAACGPRGKHDPDRTATRHGREAGSVTVGGRRVPVCRPRIRASDGSGELPVPAYELFTDTELLGRMAMERMLAGVDRHCLVALEPVGEQFEADAKPTSKSALSRRFAAKTETPALAVPEDRRSESNSGFNASAEPSIGPGWCSTLNRESEKLPGESVDI